MSFSHSYTCTFKRHKLFAHNFYRNSIDIEMKHFKMYLCTDKTWPEFPLLNIILLFMSNDYKLLPIKIQHSKQLEPIRVINSFFILFYFFHFHFTLLLFCLIHNFIFSDALFIHFLVVVFFVHLTRKPFTLLLVLYLWWLDWKLIHSTHAYTHA